MTSWALRQQKIDVGTVLQILLGAISSLLLIAGCGSGGDGSVSQEPNAQIEHEAIRGLVKAYATALQQEDIDRLQDLLQPGPPRQEGTHTPPRSELPLAAGPFADAGAFREAISATFRAVAITALQVPEETIQVEDAPLRVSFQEVESVENPAELRQQTRLYRTTFQLAREVVDDAVTFRIQSVTRDGPLVEITTMGQVRADALTRVEVQEAMTLPIHGVSVAVLGTKMDEVTDGEACERLTAGTGQHLLKRAEGHFQGAFTSLAPSGVQALCVRVRRAGVQAGEGDVVLVHRYWQRAAGEGAVQRLAETLTMPFDAVGVAPDGTIWFGGAADVPGHLGTLLQLEADGRVKQVLAPCLDTCPEPEIISARIEDLAIDPLGRLHALFIATNAAERVVAHGVAVLDPERPDNLCQTVNPFDPEQPYPFRVYDPQTGQIRLSPSARLIAADDGHIWLFGSDGGVARVANRFEAGLCPTQEVTYGPIFQRENSELSTNTVPALVVDQDEPSTPRWFGTALGLARWQHGTFTPVPFSRDIAFQGDPATLEAFFQDVAQAIFAARPLAAEGIGGVSFEAIFGGPLVKEDLIFSAVEDRRGRLWVGTLGGGIRRMEDEAQTLHLTRQNELGSNIILALAARDDTIWAATDEGVSRIRDDGDSIAIVNFSALDGLHAPVRDVAVDNEGTAWLATDRGIFRIVRQGFEAGGVVLQASEAMAQPVVGADVTVRHTPFRAVTDTDGYFSFTDLPPGRHRFHVSGDLAEGGPFTAAFSLLDLPATGCALEPVVVVRRDPAVAVNPARGGTLTFASGAELVLQPDGVEFPGAPEIGLTLLPLHAPPLPLTCPLLPLEVGALAELQPDGIRFTQPIALTLPNRERLSSERRDVLFWCLVNGETELRYLVNDGQVYVRDDVITVENARLRHDCVAVMFAAIAATAELSPAQVMEVVRASYQDGLALSLTPHFDSLTPTSISISTPTSTSPAVQGIEVLAAPPAEAVVGSTHSLVLQLTDAMGQAVTVPDVPVTFQLFVPDPRPGTAPPVLCSDPMPPDPSTCSGQLNSDTAGQIRALLTLGQTAGTLQVVATSGEAGAVSPAVITVQGLADREQGRLIGVSGNNQIALQGEELDEPLVVRLADQFGNPLEGELVMAEIIAGQGELRTEEAPSDHAGTVVTTRSDAQGEARFFLQVGEHTEDIIVRVTALDQEAQFRVIVGFSLPFGIAVEASGHLVVIDASLKAVLRVDPNSGARTVVSYTHAGAENTVGNGPPFENPKDIAVANDGGLLIVDTGAVQPPRVVRVDPMTGDRSIVADAHTGQGPLLHEPISIAREADGMFVILDRHTPPRVLRLHPTTGDRTVVSEASFENGPSFSDPIGIAVEPSGHLVVVETGLFNGFPRLIRVDPDTGYRTVVSDDTMGAGPSFRALIGVAVEASGDIIVLESGVGLSAVMRVNPVTGDRMLVSGCTAKQGFDCFGEPIGGGPMMRLPVDLAIDASGQFVVVDAGPGAVLRVAPETGERTTVSQGQGVGLGLALLNPIGIAAEPRGTLVVVEGFLGLNGVVRVVPDTGDRTVVSDANRGAGLLFNNPLIPAVETDGQLVVVDAGSEGHPSRVVRVAPDSGDRTTVSDTNRGAGPPFGNFLSGIVVGSDGALMVLEAFPPGVLRVDPVSGDRRMVSDANTGSGPHFENPFSLAAEADGHLVVAEGFDPDFGGRRAVMRVNPVSGDRLTVSDALRGNGTPFINPTGIAVFADGQLIVVDRGLKAVLRVDPDTGDRTLVSGGLDGIVGSGPPFFDPITVAVEASGSLVVVESVGGLKALVRVDPETGNRAILSK